MSTLQVQITAGAQAGSRFQLNTSPVSFGRSAENTLVIEESVVSRQHGELHRDPNGQWVLVNLSTNGTRVGRKKVTKKPFTLSDGDSVIIGETEVFRVYLITDDADADDTDADDNNAQQPAGHAPGAGLKGKSKLWIGLGIWFGVCILAMVIGAMLLVGDDDPSAAGANGAAQFWNPGQTLPETGEEADIADVKRLLLEPLPPQDPNASAYTLHLNKARDAYEQGDAGLFTAYRHYEQAISYSQNRDNPLEAFDQIKYGNAVDELAKIIAQEYRLALRLYNTGKYPQVTAVLDNLRRDYYNPPEQDDTLANHIRKLRNAAHKRGG